MALETKEEPTKVQGAQQAAAVIPAATHSEEKQAALAPIVQPKKVSYQIAQQQLMRAVKTNNCIAVDDWLLHGVDVNQPIEGEYLIFAAVPLPTPGIFKKLLEVGASTTMREIIFCWST